MKPPEEKRSKACGPPRCRTCGVAEFRHTCKGPVDIKEITEKAKSAGTKKKRKNAP